MKTTDFPTLNLSTTEKVQQEIAETSRVAEFLLVATAAEPHARVISALFTALGVLANANPCCRETVSKVAKQMGVHLACVPEANGAQVH